MSFIKRLMLLICLLPAPTMAEEATMNGLDSDAFMQMLMTQLQYQDPSKPMDQAQMVQQLSSLTMMQQNAELVEAMNKLTTQVYQSQGLYASELVGKQVMVVTSQFEVTGSALPRGEVLLTYAASALTIRVYRATDEAGKVDPRATLELGSQAESGQIPFDLSNMSAELSNGKYQMHAYALVNGREYEQGIAQNSVVGSVVIPGNGKDVLVEVRGIGLVPLYAVTEFQGEYTPEQENRVLAGLSTSQKGQNKSLSLSGQKTDRHGQTWTRNPFYNSQSVKQRVRRKPPSLRETLFRTVP